jgi:predicted AAA+ superfamily ATPase
MHRLARHAVAARHLGDGEATHDLKDHRAALLHDFQLGECRRTTPHVVPDLRGYVDLAMSGAFPLPVLHIGDPGRRRWLRGNLEQLITRDVSQLAGERDPVRMRRYCGVLAAHTGAVIEAKKLYDAAGLNAKTAAVYDRLLSSLFVLDVAPS